MCFDGLVFVRERDQCGFFFFFLIVRSCFLLACSCDYVFGEMNLCAFSGYVFSFYFFLSVFDVGLIWTLCLTASHIILNQAVF